MKKTILKYLTAWNSVLVFSVICSVFIIPVLPASWGRIPGRLAFSLMFLSAVFSLENRKSYIVYLSLFAFVMEWISGILNLDSLENISKALNGIFFIIVVGIIIKQMATARVVTARVILESISGYLLIGIIYSVAIAAIMQNDPGAFNVAQPDLTLYKVNPFISDSFYFSFVTLATLGYGDIVPLKAYSRSLATLITISGQLYIATVVALLVGKFAARQK